MRISVNLATRPFVELRPFFLRLRILMGVLAAVCIAAVIVAHVEQKKLDAATAQMDRLRAQTAAAQQEKTGNERRMRQPANAEVLDRAHFLNALFLRKSFSWTAVMMDLETVLPAGVQVTSIEPAVTAEGDVIIRLRVSGDRDRAVQLVRNLERSKRFLVPRLTGESVQAKEAAQNGGQGPNNGPPPGVEFEILANYNPLPEGEAYAKPADAAKATKAAGNKTAATRSTAAPARPGDGILRKPYAATHPPAHAAPKPQPKGGSR
jgi:type IV pilus assembly protein PilN